MHRMHKGNTNRLSLVQNLAYFFGLIFLVFLQSKHLFGGDSAEYALTNVAWAIPHPPGYPLYTFVANIFTHILFFLNPIWVSSLLSSIPTFFSAILINKIVTYLTKNRTVAFLCSLFYLVIFPVWLYAIVPEVFALNNFLILAITYSLLLFQASNKQKWALLAFFLFGLCIAHHQTFVLFIPAWFFLIPKKQRTQLLLKHWKIKLFFVLSGFLWFSYAFIVSQFHPPIDWENAKTIAGLFRLITRSSYGTFSAYKDAQPNLTIQITNLFSTFVFMIQDLRPVGTILLIIGLIATKKLSRSIQLYIYVSISCLLFFIFYSNFILVNITHLAIFERFMTIIYTQMVIIIGIGLARSQVMWEKWVNSKVRSALFSVAKYFLLVIFGITIVTLFISNLPSILSVKTNKNFETIAKKTMDSVEKNGILYTHSDSLYFAVQYLYSYTKYRPDIHLVFLGTVDRQYARQDIARRYPDLYIDTSTNNDPDKLFASFLTENNKSHPIYFETPNKVGYWLPFGLVFRYFESSDEAKLSTPSLIIQNEQFWDSAPSLVFSQNQLSILHNKTVKEAYSVQLDNYIQTLIYSKEYKLALQRLDKSGSILSVDRQTILRSLAQLETKDCNVIGPGIHPITEKDMKTLTKEEVTISLKYYGLCDAQNPRVQPLFTIYHNFNNTFQ